MTKLVRLMIPLLLAVGAVAALAHDGQSLGAPHPGNTGMKEALETSVMSQEMMSEDKTSRSMMQMMMHCMSMMDDMQMDGVEGMGAQTFAEQWLGGAEVNLTVRGKETTLYATKD